MLCTFCGTENRPENKFCGMCGVRLERRRVERRAPGKDSMKCPSCGNLTELGHRFCGMCGSRVDRRIRERRAESPEQPRATAMANAQLPPPEGLAGQSEMAPVADAPVTVDETEPASANEVTPPTKTSPAIFRNQSHKVPAIGGPSFLGLGDEPLTNGDYLLEDEGSSGGVLRRLVLIAILAAIAGLAFIGWRSNMSVNPKPAPGPKSEAAATPFPDPKVQDNTAAAAPAANKPELPSPDPPASPTERADAPAKADASAAKASESGPEKEASSGRKTPQESPDTVTSAPHHPSATLLRAQQYLQGRGVRQNCEQGLYYLKAATEKNEPAAAVQMGALYAIGHCVQRDQVTAYRWYNSAHELDPANPWIQTNLDQLWAQMTPQERQRASR